MAKALDSGFETLLAASTDGRAENVRYRQNELYRLHAALKEKSREIVSAIQSSSSCSVGDAEKEFFLGMDSVRQFYESLDFEQSIKDEYLVTTGANNAGRRISLGIVAIRPAKHSRFYSTVTPLAAAVAAGNCVLLELASPQSPIDTALFTILSGSLDIDTFYVSSITLSVAHLSKINLFIDQTAISKAPLRRSIAIVDVSADLDRAAKSIVATRLSAHGSSPYSPDLVIVNDFIGEEFGKLCFKHAISLGSEKLRTGVNDGFQAVLREAESKGQAKVHNQVSGLTVVEVRDKNSPLLSQTINGPYIITFPSTGLVSSVSTLRGTPTNLATYIFSNPKAAKFLAEQVSSEVSYINQIPSQLLVGPAAPSLHHELHPRYTTEIFSQPRPQIIEPVKEVKIGKEIKDLKPTGQRPGHAVGFFEQGIFTGLGVTAFVVLPSLAYGVFRAGMEVWKFAARNKTLLR